MSKSLIIYFSRNGNNYTNNGIRNLNIGNTEVVANYIHELTGADMFKIEPKKIYPNDYHECCIVAKEELNNNARPELVNYLDNLNEYDIIYLGYPNWWGTCPMCIFTFLEKYDFSGKTIYPFCTHEGSKMGNSENDIKNICKNSNIKNGLQVQGSYVSDSKEIIRNWIRG